MGLFSFVGLPLFSNPAFVIPACMYRIIQTKIPLPLAIAIKALILKIPINQVRSIVDQASVLWAMAGREVREYTNLTDPKGTSNLVFSFFFFNTRTIVMEIDRMCR